MDKRIIRTKRAIRSAFLDLRKDQPLEEIKVIDICSISVINKTTFYKPKRSKNRRVFSPFCFPTELTFSSACWRNH